MSDKYLIDKVSDGIQNIANSVDTFTQSAIDGTANTLTSVIDTGASGTTNIIEGTANAAKSIVETGKNLVESGIDMLKQGLDTAASAVTKVVDSVTQVADQGVDYGISNIDSAVTNEMTSFVKSYPWFLVVLKIIIIVYAAKVAPTIPLKYAWIFSNMYFRMAVLALVVWSYSHDPVASVLIAVAFFMTINYLRQNAIDQVKQTGVVTNDATLAMNQGSQPESNNKPFPGLVVYNPANTTINTPLADATGSVNAVTPPVPHSSLVAANVPMEMHQLAPIH